MKEVDMLGGEDIHEPPDREKRGCDKFHHLMRSLFYHPSHARVIGPLIEVPQDIPMEKLPEVLKKHIKRDGRR